MFFLFFTTPADRKSRKRRPEAYPRLPWHNVVLTWGLVLTWVLLMLFGVVSYWNPQWLRELSNPGIRVEAGDYKDYGDDQLRLKKYALAIAQYEQSLKIRPNQVGVLINLAIAYSKVGNVPRGIAILTDALPKAKSDTNRGALHFNLGELLVQQGKTEEALDHYRQALSFTVRQGPVYHKIGSIHRAAKRYQEAREAYELALANQLDPCLSYRVMLQKSLATYHGDAVHLPIIEEQLARDLTPEDLARYDWEIIRRMQESGLDIAQTHDQLAMVCAQLGDIPAAIDHLQKLLQIMPDSAAARENLERLQRSQRNQP